MGMMNKTYRNGPVGAMMDEYERAAAELKQLVLSLSQEAYDQIVDPDTADANCRSVATIMNHVVRAAYGYANAIRIDFGQPFTERKENYGLTTPQMAVKALDVALAYTVATLADKWDLSEHEMSQRQMTTAWGQVYDFEQMLEHALVHILRHRRQIERFLIRMEL